MGSDIDKLFSDGVKSYKENNFQHAVVFFSIVLENVPGHDKAWNALGVTYTKLERYTEAISAFRKARDLKPDNIVYQKNYDTSVKTHPDHANAKTEVIISKKPSMKYSYYCSRCGSDIQLSQEFCISCGSKLTKDIIEHKEDTGKF